MKRAAIAALLVLTVAMSAAPAFAQNSSFGQPLGWLFLSADNTAPYEPNISAAPLTPFKVYLMVSLSYSYIGQGNLDNGVGIVAWEASVDIPGLGPDIIIQSAIFRNEGAVFGTDTNIQHGMSAPIVAADTPIDLVEYNMVVFNSTGVSDVELTLGPSSPTSFDPAAPGFNDSQDIGECTNPVNGDPQACLRPFAKLTGTIINCRRPECFPPRPVAKTRWSAIKASYGN